MHPQPISPAAYWRLLRENKNFRRLWVAQIISEIGDWFYSIAIYTLLYELTGRAASVALALILQVLPQTFIGPTAGVVNDRLSRKRVMIAADLARMVIVGSMLLVRSRGMVWLVYPLLLMETLMAAFFEPARSSVIPNITGREDLALANTLSSTTWSFNLAVGSALGGLVGLLFGRDTVFILNALSFLASAWLIRSMRFDEPHLRVVAPLRLWELVDYAPMLEGMRYVARDARRAVTVFAKAGLGILGVSWVIFPIMGTKTFPGFSSSLTGGQSARGAMLGMSLLMTARGIGALLGPLLSAQWAGQMQSRLRLGVLFGFIAGGVGYVGLGSAPTLKIALVAIVLAHAGGATVWVYSTTLLQLNTQDEFRGRVFSADLGLCMLTIAASAYAAGKALDGGIDARTVAIVAGSLMAIPALAWGILSSKWKTGDVIA